MQEITYADYFQRTIEAERTAEYCYRSLAEKFSDYAELFDFWSHYADEEAMHAAELENLLKGIDSHQLSRQVDSTEVVRGLTKFFVEEEVKKVRNLEDAYQLTHQLEDGEMNNMFTFLIKHFVADNEKRLFLLDQMKQHISRLMFDFPARYGNAESRRRVTVST